ncbi:MAG: FapA family protein [Ruminococcus sp.]|jgi:uncharacterized protein (DUF342 family)|nr:FapA family protein [Ruminococcus sp.]
METQNQKTEEKLPVIDGYVKVELGEKSTTAMVAMVAPVGGGKHVTVDMIKAALADKGVCYGIHSTKIDDIVDQKLYDRFFTVAEYTPATPGKDGFIEYKFEKYTDNLPVEDEMGYVDYRELGRIRSITAGTTIAEITPPTDGTPGKDVLGREINPAPGKKAKFAVGVGTVLSLDGLTLSAASDGHLVFEKSSFVVHRSLNIKADIDFNTGNISFISDISVQGNVGEGFRVVSTGGNVTINGGVFSGAHIEATGDVILKQVTNHATVRAGGNITAGFCEYCDMRTEGDITASTLMMCEVYCGGTLVTKGSKNGGIIGGRYTVLTSINCQNNIGSPNYPITTISLGDNSILESEKERLEEKIALLERELSEIAMLVDYLNGKKKRELRLLPEHEERLGTSVKKRILINREMMVTKKRVDELTEILENNQVLRIDVSGTLYAKTRININTMHYDTEVDQRKITVSVDEFNELRIIPL